jgi:transglutaminase-like putative cysteine protease
MNLESLNLNDYLISDTIVDWKTPNVQQVAIDLTKSIPDEVAKARFLYEWVRDNIPHSDDAGLDIVTCTASEVLHHGTGVCFSKSHLLAAFLRAVNIPSGFCYQVLRLDPPVNNELVLHGFNGIYLSSIKNWIRVDARGNTKGVNAQFSIDKEQLAFHMDTLAGEFIYNTIFTSPVSNVVKKLKKHKSRRELWLDLPKILENTHDKLNPADGEKRRG